jgi:hypothetical protein
MAPTDKPPGMPRVQDEGWLIGKLLAHGHAPFRGVRGNTPSYYARLRTFETEEGARQRQRQADESARPIDGRSTQREETREDGGVVTRWGTDLERAIKYSKSAVKIGQVVAVRITGREPVYNRNSWVVPDVYRNLWEVETVPYINRRNITARKMNEDFRAARRQGGTDPVARALYLIHAGAERLAPLWYPNPDDQKRFIEGLQRALDRPVEREALIAKVAQRLAEQDQARRASENLNPRQSESPNTPRERSALVRE